MLMQVGPNRFMDPAEARRQGLKEWKPTAAPRAASGPVTRQASPPRRPAAPAYKTLPPFPDDACTGLPTHQVDREGLVTEFNALYDWLKAADAAPGTYAIRDEIFRDKVGERVDRLRALIRA